MRRGEEVPGWGLLIVEPGLGASIHVSQAMGGGLP